MATHFDPAAEVANPATTAERLAAIAATNPELGPEIASHPNTYEALLEWLHTYGTDEARLAVARRRAGVTRPPVPTDTFTPAPPVKKKRTGLMIGIIAGALTLALGAGAAVWAAVGPVFGGAASPEAAAEKTVEGVLGLDPLKLMTAFAPSEIKPWQTSIEQASRTSLGAGDDETTLDLLQELKQAVRVDLDGITYDTQMITKDVAVVRLVSGVVTLDGDSDRIADVFSSLTLPTREGMYRSWGYSDNEIAKRVQDDREYLAADLRDNLPVTVDIEQATNEMYWYGNEADRRSPFALVTVNEGGWYVSPLMTYAEFFLADGAIPATYGTHIVDAQEFGSPQEALEGTERALSRFFSTYRLDDIATVMPLAERRALSIYGPVYMNPSMIPNGALPELTFTSSSYSVDQERNHASSSIDEVTIEARDRDYGDRVEIRLRGACVEMVDMDYGHDVGRGCLTDVPAFRSIGFHEITVELVREDGAWFVSPLATAATVAAEVAETVSDHARDGRLPDLWG